MPYEIKQRDDKWCVFKEGAGDPIGCHNTQGEAQDQMAALYANEGRSVADALRAIGPNVGDLLQSRIHAVFTLVADRLYGLGYINREERKQLSHAIGQGMDAYHGCIATLGLEGRPVEDMDAWDVLENARSISFPMRDRDLVTLPAHPLRALGDGWVGGYLVVFSPGGQPRDAYGNYFEADTEFGWSVGDGRRIALYDHGLDPTIGTRSVGDGLELKKVDDVGLWVETQLDLAEEYERAMYERIIPTGMLGMSSGTAEHLMQVAEDGKFTRWIIAEGSFTVMPAEIRTRGAVQPLRTYQHTPFRSLLDDGDGRTEDADPDGSTGDPADSEPSNEPRRGAAATNRRNKTHYGDNTSAGRPVRMGGKTVDIQKLLQLIKGQMSGLSEEDSARLDAIVEAFMLGNGGDMPAEEYEEETMTAPGQLNAEGLIAVLRKAGFEVPETNETNDQPASGRRNRRPPYEFGEGDPETDDDKHKAEVYRSIHTLRHGNDIDEPTSMVLREIYDGDYRQLMCDQEQAFLRWMRSGRGDPILQQQVWSVRNVRDMLKNGMSVSRIRATMVEGMDELGGYAVPPQMQDNIIQRIRGLTAIRGGGALIVQTASSMVEWIKVTGGGDRYPSSMRGQWGDETTAGDADNFEIGLQQIPVNIYSYPVDFSRSLLEDAANLEQIFTALVADTLAIDEDEAFLIGEGTNKPRGILPNSANGDSLTEVVSQNASALTWTGLKALRRGIASQYRMMNRASWIGNSDTGSDIEQMQDGEGRDYIESLVAGEQFPKLRGTWRESEAMPDVASSAYPLIYGDLSGYIIAERLGMAVDRFHDSNTGAKKYRFEVYRRVGGKVIEPWKFAVQKVSAS